jgi:hypothetical protein
MITYVGYDSHGTEIIRHANKYFVQHHIAVVLIVEEKTE